MKMGTISGDLVIKLGLGVLLLGGVAMLIYTIKSNASAAAGALANAGQAINPANPDNIVTNYVNDSIGQNLAPDAPGKNADGSWTLGGWLFDTFNPDKAAQIAALTQPTPGYVDPYDVHFNRY